MNRRAFLASLLALAAVPAATAQTFDDMWDERIFPGKTGRADELSRALALRHVSPAEPFDERQFEDDVRKRTLTTPPEQPKPKFRRRRTRTARYHRRRRHG